MTRKPKKNSWLRQLVRIFNMGCEAHAAGEPLDANPYDSGSGNLQRQRRRYWHDGWKHAAGLAGYACDVDPKS